MDRWEERKKKMKEGRVGGEQEQGETENRIKGQGRKDKERTE